MIAFRYSTLLRYIVIAIVLLLLLDLFIFPFITMVHFPKHFLGPKALQNLLLLSLLIAVVVFYYRKKEEILPFIQSKNVTTYTGNVERFNTNHAGDVDGIIVRNGWDRLFFKFPPHMALKVMEVVNTGESATITYYYEKGKKHKLKLQSITNNKTGKLLNLERIQPPVIIPGGEQVEITVNTKQFSVDKKGKINGFISDNYLVEIKPHVMDGLINSINEAKVIKIKGIKRSANEGFVNIQHRELVKATQIELDSNTYILY